MILGRLLALGTVFATLGVLFATSRALGFSKTAALMSLILLLSVSTYMERSFRLRSETPAILFAALALWVMVWRPGLPSAGSVLVGGIFSGLAFLATQKAIYFNLSLGLAICTAFALHLSVLSALRSAAILLVGWLLVILGYGALFGGANMLAVLYQLIFGPADLALKGGTYYEGLERFVFQTLIRNPVIYCIFFSGLALTLIQIGRSSPGVVTAAVFTAVLSGLVFTHNQPWPYIFAMALPFLALWSPILWMRFVANGEQRKIGLLVVAIVTVASFGRNFFYLNHDNSLQFEVISTAETILGRDGTYFDGVGMMPKHIDTPRRWLDMPALARIAAGQDDILTALNETPPDLIIENGRTDLLPSSFGAWVSERYVAVSPGFLVPGVRVRPGEVATLNVMTSQRFRVVGDLANSTLQIDGRAVLHSVHLEAGRYAIAVRGADTPIILVPDGIAIPGRQVERREIFSNVYTW